MILWDDYGIPPLSTRKGGRDLASFKSNMAIWASKPYTTPYMIPYITPFKELRL